MEKLEEEYGIQSTQARPSNENSVEQGKGKKGGGHAKVPGRQKGNGRVHDPLLGQFARTHQDSSFRNLKSEAQDWLALVNRLKNSLEHEQSTVSSIERCLFNAYSRSCGSVASPSKSSSLPQPKSRAQRDIAKSMEGGGGSPSARVPGLGSGGGIWDELYTTMGAANNTTTATSLDNNQRPKTSPASSAPGHHPPVSKISRPSVYDPLPHTPSSSGGFESSAAGSGGGGGGGAGSTVPKKVCWAPPPKQTQAPQPKTYPKRNGLGRYNTKSPAQPNLTRNRCAPCSPYGTPDPVLLTTKQQQQQQQQHAPVNKPASMPVKSAIRRTLSSPAPNQMDGEGHSPGSTSTSTSTFSALGLRKSSSITPSVPLVESILRESLTFSSPRDTQEDIFPMAPEGDPMRRDISGSVRSSLEKIMPRTAHFLGDANSPKLDADAAAVGRDWGPVSSISGGAAGEGGSVVVGVESNNEGSDPLTSEPSQGSSDSSTQRSGGLGGNLKGVRNSKHLNPSMDDEVYSMLTSSVDLTASEGRGASRSAPLIAPPQTSGQTRSGETTATDQSDQGEASTADGTEASWEDDDDRESTDMRMGRRGSGGVKMLRPYTAPSPSPYDAGAASDFSSRGCAAGAYASYGAKRTGKGLNASVVDVYSGGARQLIKLKRDQLLRRTPEQIRVAKEIQERNKQRLVQMQTKDLQLESQWAEREQRKEDKRREYLQKQGLDAVKPKVWELPEKAELPPEKPPLRPVIAPKEVRHAANKAIRKATQSLLNNIAQDQKQALSLQAEEEERQQKKWQTLRQLMLDRVRAEREELQRELEQNGGARLAASKALGTGGLDLPTPVVHDSMAAWRKAHGVAEDTPVFVWSGSYGVGVRGRLLQRGWVENHDPHSRFFNLKWSLRGQDIMYESLGDGVLVNHFQGSEQLTTKSGLHHLIRALQNEMDEDWSHCHPRSYDPTNPTELQEFLEDYHWSVVEALLRLVTDAADPEPEPELAPTPVPGPVPRDSRGAPKVRPGQFLAKTQPSSSSKSHSTPSSKSHAAKAQASKAQATAAGEYPPDLPASPGQVLLMNVIDRIVFRWAIFACQQRLRRHWTQQASQYMQNGGNGRRLSGYKEPPKLDPRDEVWLGHKGQESSQASVLGGFQPGQDQNQDNKADNNSGQDLSQKHWEQLVDAYEEVLGMLESNGWRHSSKTGLWVPGPSAARQAKQQRVNPELPTLLRIAKNTIRIMDVTWPQYSSSQGPLNAWVVKPAEAARGEGVKCVAGVKKVLEECLNGPHRILQKYIEAPLLVRRRKVDIRQWVLVCSTNPLQVYFFNEALIRFAGARWHLHPENITDPAIHLCNHTLQCQLNTYNGGDGLDGDQNMWSSARFKQYLAEETEWGSEVWEEQVVPAMKDITMRVMSAGSRTCMTHREGSFELFGLDFMLDTQMKVWLLEVNESPDLRPRTPAKAAACSRMLDGLIQILLDYWDPNSRDPSTGGSSSFLAMRPNTATGIPETDEEMLTVSSSKWDVGVEEQDPGTQGTTSDIGGWELLDDYWYTPDRFKSFKKPSRPKSSRPVSSRARPVSAAVRDKELAAQSSAPQGLLKNGQRIMSAFRRDPKPY